MACEEWNFSYQGGSRSQPLINRVVLFSKIVFPNRTSIWLFEEWLKLWFKQEAGKLTTGNGVPVDTKTETLTVGPRGPVLIQDHVFIDDMAHFDRERIPERVVHAKGAGAFGEFVCTHDITKYCKAVPFESINKKTPVAVRFSTVGKWCQLLILLLLIQL